MTRLNRILIASVAMGSLLCGCEGQSCGDTIPAVAEIRYTNEFGQAPRDIQRTDDGGFVITGRFVVGRDPVGILLVKTDASGAALWTRRYDLGASEEGRSVQPLGDGGYIVAGYTGGPVHDFGLTQNPSELLVLRVDHGGNEVWSRSVKVDTFTVGHAVSVNSDGSFAVAGSAGELAPGDQGALLIKFDADGNQLWRRQLLVGAATTPWDVISTSDGGYAMAGFNANPFGAARSRDIYVVKTDEEGAIEWEFQGGESIPIDGLRMGRGIVQTRDGGYAIAGTSIRDMAGKLFVTKLAGDGALEWVLATPGEPHAEGYDIIEAADGSLVAVGVSYALNPFVACERFYVARVSESGALQWTGRLESELEGIATTVAYGLDGNFVVAGYSSGVRLRDRNTMFVLVTEAGGTDIGQIP